MPLEHCHRNSQSVEKFSPIVCILSTRRVGLKVAEELTYCSPHLPSWVDDSQFEQAIDEVFDAGRSNAGGSFIMEVDASCNVDNSDDPRRSLVCDLCNQLGLLPLS